MEIMAASAFVAAVLLGNGLFPTFRDNLPMLFVLLSLNIGAGVWLAAAASLWPFYVLAAFHGLALILVVIAGVLKAWVDADKAKMENTNVNF